MKKLSTHNGIDGLNLQRLAYRDYLAARFLLLNDYLIQGVTLSSSAVEKYLKSILSIVGAKKLVHLNQIAELDKLLRSHGLTILSEIDEVYLEMLGIKPVEYTGTALKVTRFEIRGLNSGA